MQDNTPAVAILPYGQKLGLRPARLPLDAMNWPLGQPARLRGGKLGDLEAGDHLIVYPSGSAHLRPGFGTRAKVSMLVVEPTALHGRHLDRLKGSHRRFHRVLSANEAFLGAVPNGVFLPFGSTWIPDWAELDLTKHRMTSLIASSKRDLEGHRLRHDIVDWAAKQDIALEVMGRGYRAFDRKSDGLAPYRFSVVIENVREASYFTEKLVDCVLCETVPIYWGCPNIARFMETGGMILCDTSEDIKAALAGANEARFQQMLPALRRARAQAAHWAELEPRAARAVLAD